VAASIQRNYLAAPDLALWKETWQAAFARLCTGLMLCGAAPCLQLLLLLYTSASHFTVCHQILLYTFQVDEWHRTDLIVCVPIYKLILNLEPALAADFQDTLLNLHWNAAMIAGSVLVFVALMVSLFRDA
jgi:hypothetical protein